MTANGRTIPISLAPLIKVQWTVVLGHKLYQIRMSFDQPTSILELDLVPIVVTEIEKSGLKKAFINTLKKLLSSFDSVSIDKYQEAVKKFKRPQIDEQARYSVTLMRGKNSVEHTILISPYPKLVIGWKIKKNRLTRKYTISMYMDEPQKIPKITIPHLEATTSESGLRIRFAELLNEILQSFLTAYP